MTYDQAWINSRLDQMAAQLRQLLDDKGRQDIRLVGIQSGGVWLAEALRDRLGDSALGTLDISFYRDDFSRRGLHPSIHPSALPFEVDDQHLVLVDDVLMTGRTIRAALNELFDYGRPASVTLVVLFDVGQRELPVSPDICGEALALAPHQRVELRGPAPLHADIRSV